MTIGARCEVCRVEDETLDHVLRGCIVALLIWKWLVWEEKFIEFMTMQIPEWVNKNISNPKLGSVLERSLRLQQQCIGAMENADNSIISSRLRNVHLVSWSKPISGWYKLNIDGAQKPSTGVSACGGVIRDWNGEWVVGFSRLFSSCSIWEVEILGFFLFSSNDAS
ncbi:hypothetical protein GOBAR_DD07310 [Gossypium barbadense]|nr:hypothetical protein GOBAR_DD07310 [Gossypium barbadense]